MGLSGISLGIAGITLGISGLVFGAVAISMRLGKLIEAIKDLPDQLATKLIEKQREEEDRKLFEQKSDPKSE